MTVNYRKSINICLTDRQKGRRVTGSREFRLWPVQHQSPSTTFQFAAFSVQNFCLTFGAFWL